MPSDTKRPGTRAAHAANDAPDLRCPDFRPLCGSPRAVLYSFYPACPPAGSPDDAGGANTATNQDRVPLAAFALMLAAAAPLQADARSDAKKQVEFGISVAQRGLWREAIYRWERAAQMDPTYAAAYNNLAVAYEHEGDLDKARTAYEKAIE